MLRRSKSLRYYHDVPKDLVPEGFRASRYHSNHTPSQRFNTQLEYALSPVFGSTSSGEFYPLVTLAVGENCQDPREFTKRFKNGLTESLNDIAKVDDVVYAIKFANEQQQQQQGTDYRQYDKFYQITTGIILHPRHTPWGVQNREKTKMDPETNSLGRMMLSKINRQCLGIEVYLNICTSKNQLRGDRKVKPENWIEQEEEEKEDQTTTNMEEKSTTKKTDAGNNNFESLSSALELEEKELEYDLAIFSELQQNLLESVNNTNNNTNNRLLRLRHNIQYCFPGHLPHPVEHVMNEYMGVEVSERKLDEVAGRWKERVAKFS